MGDSCARSPAGLDGSLDVADAGALDSDGDDAQVLNEVAAVTDLADGPREQTVPTDGVDAPSDPPGDKLDQDARPSVFGPGDAGPPAFTVVAAFDNNFLVDVTGDGLADVVHLERDRNSIGVQSAMGVKFSGYVVWSLGFAGRHGTFFADVTGDGAADAIAVDDASIRVKASTTKAFGAEKIWRSEILPGTRGTFFADVTGDGKADLITINDSAIEVYRSSGQGFESSQIWSSQPFQAPLGSFFADVNGDGSADLVAWGTTSVDVLLSSGTAFETAQPWADQSLYGNLGVAVADVTGDRRADLVSVTDSGVHVRPSTGTGFGASTLWTSGVFSGDHGTFFADVNGDGKADALGIASYYMAVNVSSGTAFTEIQTWSEGVYFGTLITCGDPNPGYHLNTCFVVNETGVNCQSQISSAASADAGADDAVCDASTAEVSR